MKRDLEDGEVEVEETVEEAEDSLTLLGDHDDGYERRGRIIEASVGTEEGDGERLYRRCSVSHDSRNSLRRRASLERSALFTCTPADLKEQARSA